MSSLLKRLAHAKPSMAFRFKGNVLTGNATTLAVWSLSWIISHNTISSQPRLPFDQKEFVIRVMLR